MVRQAHHEDEIQSLILILSKDENGFYFFSIAM